MYSLITLIECKYHDEESVEKYVRKTEKTARKLIKLAIFDTADLILNNCYNDIVSKTTKAHNSEKIIIFNARAELKLVRKDIKGSLEDLKLCYRLA